MTNDTFALAIDGELTRLRLEIASREHSIGVLEGLKRWRLGLQDAPPVYPDSATFPVAAPSQPGPTVDMMAALRETALNEGRKEAAAALARNPPPTAAQAIKPAPDPEEPEPEPAPPQRFRPTPEPHPVRAVAPPPVTDDYQAPLPTELRDADTLPALTDPQYRMFMAVRAQEGRYAKGKDLAKAAGIPEGSYHAHIYALRDRGYIDLVDHPLGGGRKVCVVKVSGDPVNMDAGKPNGHAAVVAAPEVGGPHGEATVNDLSQRAKQVLKAIVTFADKPNAREDEIAYAADVEVQRMAFLTERLQSLGCIEVVNSRWQPTALGIKLDGQLRGMQAVSAPVPKKKPAAAPPGPNDEPFDVAFYLKGRGHQVQGMDCWKKSAWLIDGKPLNNRQVIELVNTHRKSGAGLDPLPLPSAG